MRGRPSPWVLSRLLQERTEEEEESFLKHRTHLSWEPIGRQSLGNLCKGPSVALHPSPQVTEFTSLIIGGNRKVIGIECCHRINVSQLHINVSTLLYYLCLRNTVASKCCLSTVWKPSALAWPTHSLTRGSQKCLLQLRPTSVRARARTHARTRFIFASLQLARGREAML